MFVCVCLCVCVGTCVHVHTFVINQKEEMGEVLHEVDFNQLKIENQQYIEKIDERNQDLLRLKLMAGNTLQVLNSYKVRKPQHSEITLKLYLLMVIYY